MPHSTSALLSNRLEQSPLEALAPYACTFDKKGKITEVNDAFAEALKTRKSELKGKAFKSLFSPSPISGKTETELDLTNPGFYDLHIQTENDGIHSVWNIEPYSHENDETFLALGWDTNSNQAPHNLSRLLANATDLSQEIIIITDAKGTIQFANPSFFKETGFSASDIIGKSPTHFVNLPEDIHIFQNLLMTLRKGDIWEDSISIRTIDDNTLNFKIRILPIQNKTDERNIAYIAVGTNISREHHLARQVEELQRLEALGTLANGIAHQFNNILASISGQTELLKMVINVEPKVEERFNRILQSVEKGRKFVKELNHFSRKEKGPMRLTDITPVIRHAFNFVESIRPKNVNIEAHMPKEMLKIMANTDEVHQVIVNLFTNAFNSLDLQSGIVKLIVNQIYADPRPHNKEGAGHEQPCISIEVCDNGPGVPKHLQHRLFEPFFTTQGFAQSTGMGLAVAHGIMKRHGGSIHHRTEGEWTIFELRFPIPQLHTQSQSPSEARGHIILIDDNPFSLENGCNLLKSWGFTVTTCELGEQALEALVEPTDLIITNSVLPDQTAYHLIETLRQRGIQTPVILCPTMDEPIEWNLIETLNIAKILPKPASIDDLHQSVKALIASDDQ